MGCGASLDAASAQIAPADKADRKHQFGLHITGIRQFIADHPLVISEHLTTSQINRKHVKPETEGTNAPYIQKLIGVKDHKTGVPFVSQATVFVSHAWRYKFYDVVVSVMEQYASEHPDTYFWIDLFTNNQNEVASKDFNWFSSTFLNGINDIGEVLLVLSPWNDPMPIRRAWCLFEIHNAIAESEVKLSIDIPHDEAEELKAGIMKDSDCVVQALSDIQAEKAEATSESDLELIFKAISESDGGFSRVNQQVKEQLRSWYISQLKLLIKRSPDDTTLMLKCAVVMNEFAFLDEALFHYQNALRIDLDLRGGSHINVANSYGGIADVYRKKADAEKALEYYQKSLKIMLDTLGDNHPDVAEIYNNMALVYSHKAEYDKALEYFHESIKMDLDKLGDNHSNLASYYNNMANVYRDKADLDKALEYYHKALKIMLDTLGDNHPNVATTYNNMALAYSAKEDNDKALEYYHKALIIILDTLGDNHPNVATTYNNMALVYSAKADNDKALEYNHKTLKIQLDTYGDNHPDVAVSYSNMACVYRDNADYDKALEYHQKSLKIELDTLGDNHPSVGTTYNNMAALYSDEADYGKALEYFHKSITIMQRKLGDDHPSVTTIRQNIKLMEQEMAGN